MTTYDQCREAESGGRLVLAVARCALALGLLVASFLVGACSTRSHGNSPIEHYRSAPTRALGLPFSDAVRAGDVLYVSGQIGNKPGTLTLVPGGIGPETRQTIENLKAILEANGSGLDRVVKCTVFLADISEWPAMNEVYRQYFTGEPPARSAVAGSGLALGARVEIDCIAVIDEKQAKAPK